MHQTNWDIPVSRSNILPPQLSFPRIHKSNHVFQESVKKVDPDNLEASLDKFDLAERGYKLEEIKRGFLEALKFLREKFIAERPNNKQPPLVYITLISET